MKLNGLLAAFLGFCNYATASLLDCACTPGAVGVPGGRGVRGPNGVLGRPGPIGGRGFSGRIGAIGPAGDKGIIGPTGGWQSPAGPAGLPGPPGLPGSCFDCMARRRARFNNWGSGAGFGGGVGADGIFNGGGGVGGGGGNGGNGFGSGFGYGSGPNSGGGGSGGGGSGGGGTVPGSLIMLPQYPNVQQKPHRHVASANSAFMSGAFPPDGIVIISPNGERMSISSLQSLNFAVNRGEAPRPEFSQGMGAQQQVRPQLEMPAIPQMQPIPQLRPTPPVFNRPSNAVAVPSISDLNEWQREVLLGELLSSQSSGNVADKDTAVNDSTVGVEVNPTKQPFPFQKDTQLITNQIEDSLAEFQRALDEFRRRFAQLTASINRKGRHIAIVL